MQADDQFYAVNLDLKTCDCGHFQQMIYHAVMLLAAFINLESLHVIMSLNYSQFKHGKTPTLPISHLLPLSTSQNLLLIKSVTCLQKNEHQKANHKLYKKL